MTRFSLLAEQLSTRYWKLLFICMLVLLHFASVRGAGDWWARALMLAHCGLFIIWQPFLQRSRHARWSEVALIAAAATAILYSLNWWLLGLWVTMLAGLVGGKVFIYHQRWIRLFHLVVLAYLTALLLLWIVPNGFPGGRHDPIIDLVAIWGLPTLFVVVLLMPVESDSAESQIVDLFYATLIFLLLVVLVLGTFAFMTIGQLPYGLAVAYMAVTLGTVLICPVSSGIRGAGLPGSRYFFRAICCRSGCRSSSGCIFLPSYRGARTSRRNLFVKRCRGSRNCNGWQAAFGRRMAMKANSAPSRHSRLFTRPRISTLRFSAECAQVRRSPGISMCSVFSWHNFMSPSSVKSD